jgi:molybdopterin converting factor small subunit
MSITVRVSALLQKLTQNQAEVKADGANRRELIDDLEKSFPGLEEEARFLVDGSGNYNYTRRERLLQMSFCLAASSGVCAELSGGRDSRCGRRHNRKQVVI